MPNGKLLFEVHGMVKEINQKLDTVCTTVEGHGKLLMGNPENMGRDGMVATVARHTNQIQGMGSRVDKYRQSDALRIHGINGFINLLIAGIMNYLMTHFHRGN